MAHIAARPSISSLRIWNRTAPRAEALAADLRAQGIRAEATEDLDAAVAEADVISCVTMSRKPLVRGALLKPGAHVDLVGAYLPDMREADDDTLRRGTVFTCCDRGRDEVGELTLPVATGALSWDDIRGDAFGIVQGRDVDALQIMRLQSTRTSVALIRTCSLLSSLSGRQGFNAAQAH